MKKWLGIIPVVFIVIFSFLQLSTRPSYAAECWINDKVTCTIVARKECDEKTKQDATKTGYMSTYGSQKDCIAFANQTNATPTPIPPTPTPTINPNAPTPDPSKPEGSGANGVGYTLSPPFTEIDDATDKVTITFNSLPSAAPGDPNIYLCMEGDLCIDNDSIRDGMSEGKDSSFQKARAGLLEKDVDAPTLMRYRFAPGSNSITFCGDGESKLKADGTDASHPNYKGKNGGENGDWCDKMGKDRHGCVQGRDFFHAGKVYVMGIYTHEPGSEKGDLFTLHDVAGIYINHHHPNSSLSPLGGLIPDLTHLSVALTSDTTKAPYGKYAGPNDVDMAYHNNYQVQLINGSYQKSVCGTVTKDTPPKDTVFPFDFPPNTLQPGKLTVTIREQINENPLVISTLNRPLSIGDDLAKVAFAIKQRNPFLDVTGSSLCQGGFIYRRYECQVSKDATLGKCQEFKTTLPPDPTHPDDPPKVEIKQYIDDPNKEDIKGLMTYFDKLGASGATSIFPCNIGSVVQNNPSKCEAVDTIPIDPLGFIMKLFTIGLSVAGIGALILIIVSGYRILMSRGNPDTIKSARETLTSAIVGLIFLIFSIVILSVIAGDILKIPGFTP